MWEALVVRLGELLLVSPVGSWTSCRLPWLVSTTTLTIRGGLLELRLLELIRLVESFGLLIAVALIRLLVGFELLKLLLFICLTGELLLGWCLCGRVRVVERTSWPARLVLGLAIATCGGLLMWIGL